MPYIKPEDRSKFKNVIEESVNILSSNGIGHFDVGEVNYLFSKILWRLFDQNPKYATANNLVGVLDSVKTEFQRRKVGPYEDKKIAENGDI